MSIMKKAGGFLGNPFGITSSTAGSLGDAGKSFGDSAFGPGLGAADAERLMEQSRQNREKYAEFSKQQRLKDMEEGRARGQQLFGNQGLGRVGQERAQEVADLIARRQQESQGFSPQEMEAFRSQQLPNLQRDLATQQRALRQQQAGAGVFGPAALAQQKALQASSQAAKGEMERNMFLDNIMARRQGLGSLEKSILGAREDELGREKFNLGQLGREKFGELGTEMGYAGLGAQERAGAAQQALGETSALFGAQKGKK